MSKILCFFMFLFLDQFVPSNGRQLSISVEKFGAKGDGTTDDTFAIQQAINSSYQTITFSKRNYIVDGQIALKSNKKLLGNQTTIKRSKLNSSKSILYGDNITNITIKGMKFIGNVSKNSQDYLANASVIRIINSKKINLINVYTSGGSSGVQVYYSNTVDIENLVSKNNILTGLSVIANNIKLSNSKITKNGYSSNGLTHDAYFINSSNVEIKNSIFGYTRDNKAFSLVIRYDLSDAKPLFDKVENVYIFNNTFHSNGLSIGSDPGIGVNKRKPPKNIKIYDNNFNWSDIKIDDPESILTYNNKMINNYICRVASSYPQYNMGLVSTNDHCKNIIQSSLIALAKKSTSSIIFKNTIIENNLSNGLQNAKGFGGVKAFTLQQPKVNGNVNVKGENSKVKINK